MGCFSRTLESEEAEATTAQAPHGLRDTAAKACRQRAGQEVQGAGERRQRETEATRTPEPFSACSFLCYQVVVVVVEFMEVLEWVGTLSGSLGS